MTSATHYAFSYLVVSVSGAPPQIALPVSLLSLVPDIDHPDAFMGRIFPYLSKRILSKYGHRTVSHSIFAVMAVAVLFSPALFFSSTVFFAAVMAYASHIFLDLFNHSGVRLLAPYSLNEYISFRTVELRILVSSWKEYVLLFVFVFLSFSVTGQSFSIHQAVRFLSKVFYRHYDGALKDFQDNSEYICNAKVMYFDNVNRGKKSETLQVLAMFPEKAYLLRGEERLILKKDIIDEIEIVKTSQKVSQRSLSGSSLEELSSIPAGSFISGTITIQGYAPAIKNSNFFKVEKGVDKITLVLSCVTPWELREIRNIDRDRRREFEDLKLSLCSYQIAQLQGEVALLKRKIVRLKSGGFYKNYSSIIKLNKEKKKIESRIETLHMQQVTGADKKVLQSIQSMSEGFSVEYSLNILLP